MNTSDGRHLLGLPIEFHIRQAHALRAAYFNHALKSVAGLLHKWNPTIPPAEVPMEHVGERRDTSAASVPRSA